MHVSFFSIRISSLIYYGLVQHLMVEMPQNFSIVNACKLIKSIQYELLRHDSFNNTHSSDLTSTFRIQGQLLSFICRAYNMGNTSQCVLTDLPRLILFMILVFFT